MNIYQEHIIKSFEKKKNKYKKYIKNLYENLIYLESLNLDTKLLKDQIYGTLLYEVFEC